MHKTNSLNNQPKGLFMHRNFKLPNRYLIKKISANYGILLISIFLVIVVSIPLLWMLSGSLKTLHEIFKYPIKWVPETPQWKNYIEAWTAAPFTRYLINSLFVAVSIEVGQFFTVTLAAYALSRLIFPGRDIIFMGILAMMMVPMQVTIVPLYITLSNFGWIDTYSALIIPLISSAFGIFLVRQSFLQVPQSLLDAARIDGCSHLRIIWSVMIPSSMPAIVTFMIFNFIHHYNDYFWPLIVTNSDSVRTIPIGLAIIKGSIESGISWHLIMAATTISLIPSVIIFLFGQRYFVKGIVTSGIKG